MNIIVACERYGLVRDAFIKKGHNAISCDLLPAENGGPHIIGNVERVLNCSWDMLIGFPPCTYLTNARNPYYAAKWKYKYPDNDQKRKEGI